MTARILLWLTAGSLFAADLPVVERVEAQPLAAQAARLAEALVLVGEPLPEAEATELRGLAASPNGTATVRRVQQLLDRHCLAAVTINPEMRVSVTPGPARPELIEHGWRTFLLKVVNEAGVTPALRVTSPVAGALANKEDWDAARRFLTIETFDKPPLRPLLSGLEVEYRLVQLYSRDAGKREAKLVFDVGQGTQDLGFRNEIDVLFTARPSVPVTFRIRDENGEPTTAALTIRNAQGRVYPSPAKRLAPDMHFHAQVYRSDGETVTLPTGRYSVEATRGPEYRVRRLDVVVGTQPVTATVTLERWIDPAARGWISGDHHIHAAGCSHYVNPTQGVYPADMMRQILGEDLKVGAVLTWGPGWYFQKTFFEGKEHALSTPQHRMRYDVEVSGFPSSHTGHLCLLGLREQDYPGTKRIEDWPSWGVPVLQWARRQGAITGYAHTGWGLAVKDTRLPNDEVPPFDGIGANEYVVAVTQGLVDFISAVDTPYHWELNVWYHTLSVGYRTRLSGETDYPCITDDRVGAGRSYVKQRSTRDYQDWVEGIRAGRAYVSDGRSHLMDFAVDDVAVGEQDSEVRLSGPGEVTITASVAALLEATPDAAVRARPPDQKPYWHLERARSGTGRMVPIELIVNGEAVARQEVEADGIVRPVRLTRRIDRSSWVALRILPSSHTNPVFVTVGGQPIRASRRSAEWCVKAVDQCWRQKEGRIRPEERGAARQAYEAARADYQRRLAETR